MYLIKWGCGKLCIDAGGGKGLKKSDLNCNRDTDTWDGAGEEYLEGGQQTCGIIGQFERRGMRLGGKVRNHGIWGWPPIK